MPRPSYGRIFVKHCYMVLVGWTLKLARTKLRFKSGSMRGWNSPDCISFELMRCLKIGVAFAFDRHFSEGGFNRLPKYHCREKEENCGEV